MIDNVKYYGWVIIRNKDYKYPDRMVKYSTPYQGSVWVDCVDKSDTVSPFDPSATAICIGPVIEYLGDNNIDPLPKKRVFLETDSYKIPAPAFIKFKMD